MRIVTQNVKAVPPMSPRAVRHDVQRTEQDAGVILWQEIKFAYYRDIICDMGPEWAHYMPSGDQGSQPISWRRRYYRMVGHDTIRLHKGVRMVCENRYSHSVHLERKNTNQSFWVNNCHYVAGAWNDKPKYKKELRKQMWTEGNAKHKEQLARLLEDGLPVIGGGDFNRCGDVLGDKIGNHKVRYLTVPASIDHLWCMNGESFVWDQTGDRFLGGRMSDHRGLQATLHLERRR